MQTPRAKSLEVLIENAKKPEQNAGGLAKH